MNSYFQFLTSTCNHFRSFHHWRRITTVFIMLLSASVQLSQAYGITLPKLSEREVLARCYNQITGYRLGSSSALWSRLKNETASSVCLSILNSVQLDVNGQLNNPHSTTAKAVLKQFIDIHRSWFDQQWAHLNTFPGAFWGGVDVYDPQEPALFLTRNLLSGEAYGKVLQGTDTAHALRDGSKIIPTLPTETGGFLRVSRLIPGLKEGPSMNSGVVTYIGVPPFSPTEAQNLEAPLVEMGEPIGIKLISLTSSPLLPAIWTDATSNKASASTPGISVPHAFMANRGGGALGSVPYLIFNLGHGFEYTANGADKLPRRYILSVFKNFLCRQGPFVRTSDVAPWKSNLEQAPAFRKSEACLRCHVTLDQAALLLRNLRLGSTTPGYTNDFRSPPILAQYEVDSSISPNEFWPAVAQTNFNRTKPEGRLMFRSITGQLIDVPTNSLETLGKSLSETPDYYACAAKRYFEFFTHNKVELFDPFDPSNETLIESMTEQDHKMKAFVLALGQELQISGSLKTLVRKIFESEYYSQGNFGQ